MYVLLSTLVFMYILTDVFDIDATSGEIHVINSLDRETTPQYVELMHTFSQCLIDSVCVFCLQLLTVLDCHRSRVSSTFS